MLDAYIIDQIQREERERQRHEEGRRIRLELPMLPSHRPRAPETEEEQDRGPVIIPLDHRIVEFEEDAA